jgi:hypothetical protein
MTSSQPNTPQTSFGFTADQNVAGAVPDGGLTSALLGGALMLMGGLRRIVRR